MSRTVCAVYKAALFVWPLKQTANNDESFRTLKRLVETAFYEAETTASQWRPAKKKKRLGRERFVNVIGVGRGKVSCPSIVTAGQAYSRLVLSRQFTSADRSLSFSRSSFHCYPFTLGILYLSWFHHHKQNSECCPFRVNLEFLRWVYFERFNLVM